MFRMNSDLIIHLSLYCVEEQIYIFNSNSIPSSKHHFFRQSVPETWNKQVSDIIQHSQSERAASRVLRERIAKGIAQASKTLSEMWEAVNASLAQRIRELTDARNQLQASLGKVSGV